MRINAVLCLVLAASWAACPGAAAADTRARKYYYEDITEPFFAPDPARPGYYRNQRPGSRPASFSKVKAPGAFRVFVLGGSIASLLQYADEKGEFANALGAVLPGKTVEVINCGMAGYDSFREALVEQEVLEYSPDLLVFLTGHNEGLASAPIPIWIMRTQERLSRFSAFRALVAKLRPDAGSLPEHSDATADSRDETFARNLSDNIRHARERGVQVAVVVPPRNYREPVELDRTLYDAVFVPGWVKFLRGDYEDARKSWKSSLERSDARSPVKTSERAFTWGFIARSEEKLGLLSDARDSFRQASRYDRAAICGARCQDIIRRVTAERGGFLVESDQMFQKQMFPRMPGLETFNDRMHWKPRFNCLMSVDLIDSFRAQPAFGALPWDAERMKALAASCPRPGTPSTEEDERRILSYVLMGLSWPEFRRLSPVSVFYLQAVYHDRPAWFKDIPKMVKLTKNPQTVIYGLEMAPLERVLPRFYWHIGEMLLLEKDIKAATVALSKAVELEPTQSWARVSLGVALALRGDKPGALKAIRAAVEGSAAQESGSEIRASAVALMSAFGLGGAEQISASNPGFWIERADAAIAAGRKAEALANLDKALALGPPAHELRRIGQGYSRLSEYRKHLSISDQLLKAYPQDADMWVMRAEAALNVGENTIGEGALDKAESLNPGEGGGRIISFWRGRLAAQKNPPSGKSP